MIICQSRPICPHNNATFWGLYSLVGQYRCEECHTWIEPVIYHGMKGLPSSYLWWEHDAILIENRI